MGRIQKIQKLHKITIIFDLRGLFALIFLSVLLSGCVTNMEREEISETVVLDHAEVEIPESQLLDVRIEIFDPGELPESEDEARGLSEEIRKAESYYIPVHLKNSMQRTGHWGAVRVVPADTLGAEVLVTGRIIQSNGEVLELEISVYDATNKHWFSKTYQSTVDSSRYETTSENRLEVFQSIYDRIANDCAEYRSEMSPDQITTIRQVAEMRFAVEFAPNVFEGYLSNNDQSKEEDTHEDKDTVTQLITKLFAVNNLHNEQNDLHRYSINRLPAEDDAMLTRVRRVRERDYLLVDTIDSQYESLYRKMGDYYNDWRRSRTTEVEIIRKIEAEANAERVKGVMLIIGAVLIGAMAGDSGHYNPGLNAAVGGLAGAGVTVLLNNEIDEEAEINRAALEELGESFSTEIKPVVVEVEGETVELTGSADAIYSQWREVLRQLHESEGGLLVPEQARMENRL